MSERAGPTRTATPSFSMKQRSSVIAEARDGRGHLRERSGEVGRRWRCGRSLEQKLRSAAARHVVFRQRGPCHERTLRLRSHVWFGGPNHLGGSVSAARAF